jgi:hypothetical protein
VWYVRRRKKRMRMTEDACDDIEISESSECNSVDRRDIMTLVLLLVSSIIIISISVLLIGSILCIGITKDPDVEFVCLAVGLWTSVLMGIMTTIALIVGITMHISRGCPT